MKSIFDQKYYKINKFFMSGLGIWPEQSVFMRCLLPLMYILSLLSILIPEANRAILMRAHINITVEAVIPIFVIIIVFLKLLNGSFNVHKMRIILSKIDGHWAQMEKSPNMEILRKHGNRIRLNTLGFVIFVYAVTAFFLILPVVPVILDIIIPLNESRPKEYLFQTEYHVDPEKYFYEILFHAYITSVIAMSIYIAVDSMFFAVVEHACGLFELVGFNITKVNLSSDRSDNDDYKKICYCVELHTEALRFAELIESNYSMAFTPIIGLSLSLMSISGVQVVLNLGNFRAVVRYGMFVFGEMFHILFNSIYGQKISDYSLEIHDYVYGSDWIDFSIQNQKLLTLILMRSQKPSLISAGKIYILSMASFSAVMQTACSYFTVLASMI